MNLNPLEPGHYAPANLMLIKKGGEDIQKLVEKWDDEAYDAVLDGNVKRADYIEWMIARLRMEFR